MAEPLDSDPYLMPSHGAGEPLAKAHVDGAYPGGAYSFLLRFSFVLAIFLLAVWIAYLAH